MCFCTAWTFWHYIIPEAQHHFIVKATRENQCFTVNMCGLLFPSSSEFQVVLEPFVKYLLNNYYIIYWQAWFVKNRHFPRLHCSLHWTCFVVVEATERKDTLVFNRAHIQIHGLRVDYWTYCLCIFVLQEERCSKYLKQSNWTAELFWIWIGIQPSLLRGKLEGAGVNCHLACKDHRLPH